MIKTLFILLLAYNFCFAQAIKEVNSTKLNISSSNDQDDNAVIVLSPSSLTSSLTYTLPTGSGTNSQILSTDNSGSFYWQQSPNGGSDPSSPITGVQFNNSSNFGASNSFTWDNTNSRLNLGSTTTYTVNVIDNMISGGQGSDGLIVWQKGSYFISFRANTSTTASTTFSLPAKFGTGNLNALFTNSSASLSWGGKITYGPTGSGATITHQDNSINGYIAGGDDNDITNPSDNTVIYGGISNLISNGQSDNAAIISGNDNQIDNSSINRVLLGGTSNIMSGGASDNGGLFVGEDNELGNQQTNTAIFSGFSNIVSGSSPSVAIAAGNDNQIDGSEYSVILGGNLSYIESSNSSIICGANHLVNGDYSTILFGENIETDGNKDFKFAGGRDVFVGNDLYQVLLGRNLTSGNKSSWIFGDAGTTILSSTNDNRWSARFDGGYYFYTNTGATVGMSLTTNSWVALSDSTKKERIMEIDYSNFYNKIDSLAIMSWNYKDQDTKSQRSYGPMAQTFFSLYGNDKYGTHSTDTTLATSDYNGVFISALKGASIHSKSIDDKINSTKLELINTKQSISKIEERIKKLEKQIK
ncbi:hypothetical protein OAQ99_00720 [Candidatus Kapabacteria bacterium]|nr:hypothetical protein [Candidatus Kapabacteria bacterium]